MATSTEIKPLALLVNAYLWLHRKTSLRALLFGVDPSKTPEYISNCKYSSITRDTLVDVYALLWPAFDCLLLWFAGSNLMGHPHLALIVGIIVAYRVNELLGGIFHVLIKRAGLDGADGRKLAISLLAYIEPILLFGVIHGSLAAVLAGQSGAVASSGYSLGGRAWNWALLLHYSVGCYTTAGWGDVSANRVSTMFMSDIETVTGILMLACTISRFIAAAVDSSMTKAPGEHT